MENFFCGSKLDRLSEKRNDSAFILGSLRTENAEFIVFDSLSPLALENTNNNALNYTLFVICYKEVLQCFQGSPSLASAAEEEVVGTLLKKGLIVLLGQSENSSRENDSKPLQNDRENQPKYHFAVDVTSCKTQINDLIAKRHVAAKYLSSRGDIFMLSQKDAAFVAQGRSMLDWNKRYAFCPTCGAHTDADDAGYKRTCVEKNCSSNKGINSAYHNTDDNFKAIICTEQSEILSSGSCK